MDIYRQEILHHARNPQHWGLLPHHDIRGSEANVTCGDEITIDITFAKREAHSAKRHEENNDKRFALSDLSIKSAGFEGSGCIVMLASADMLAEYVRGKTIHDIMAMPDQVVFDFFGGKLTPSRQTCALLPLIALRKGAITARQRIALSPDDSNRSAGKIMERRGK